MLAVLDTTGNASSIHAEGRAARGTAGAGAGKNRRRRRDGGAQPRFHQRRDRGRQSGADPASARGARRAAVRSAAGLGRRARLRAQGPSLSRRRGRDPAADPGRRGFAGGARFARCASTRAGASCSPCRRPTTRPASSSPFARRRRLSTRRAGCWFATRPRPSGAALQHSRIGRRRFVVFLAQARRAGRRRALAFSRGDLHMEETVLRGGGQKAAAGRDGECRGGGRFRVRVRSRDARGGGVVWRPFRRASRRR